MYLRNHETLKKGGYAAGLPVCFPLVPCIADPWSILAYLNDSLSAVIVRRLGNSPSTQSPVSAHAPPPSPHHQHATTLPFFKRAPQISQRRLWVWFMDFSAKYPCGGGDE